MHAFSGETARQATIMSWFLFSMQYGSWFGVVVVAFKKKLPTSDASS